MQQWYNCPRCQQYIQYGAPQCHNCGCPMTWGPPQQVQSVPQEPEKKVSKSSKTGLIVLGILIVLFVGTCSICLNSGSKSSSTSTTQTSVTNGSSALQSYLTELLPLNTSVGNKMTALGSYLQNPKLTDATWVNNLKSQLYSIRSDINEIRAISPPPAMSTIHSKYVSGMNRIYKSTDLILSGLDTMNPDYLNQAVDEMNYGSSDITEAGTMLQQYKANNK